METKQDDVPLGSIWDTPNLITLARIDLTILCFIFLSFDLYRLGLVCFIIAAATDWLDGWWARRYNQISQFGRVMDPFADKFLICGVFVFLAAIPGSDIAPWMAALVLGRELLVTALRSFVESSGGDFSAQHLGKMKMVWQCVAAAGSLLQVSAWAGSRFPGPWVVTPEPRFDFVDVAIWISLVFTVWSGWEYVWRAIEIVVNEPDEAP